MATITQAYKDAKGSEYNAAVCGDGISVKSFEELSAKSSGKTLEEWRKAVVEALSKAAAGDETLGGTAKNPNTITQAQADEFHKVADALDGKVKDVPAWTSPDQLENVLNGKVDGITGFGNSTAGYNQHRKPMWMYLKKKGLAYEGYWQHETSQSWVNKAGKRIYADGGNDAYFVVATSDPRKVGTFAKITAPNGNSIFARLGDKGPALGEISMGAWKALGYSDVNPNASPDGVKNLKIQVFDNSSSPVSSYEEGYLTNDEIQRAGKLIEDGKVKSISTRKELEDAEKAEKEKAEKEKDKKPEPAKGKGGAPQKQGGLRLLKGFQTVAIGPTLRRVGYACDACVHEGGGFVKEGSATVYVGKYPFARVGDGTSDALAVVSGADTVFVGGPPSSATLVA